MAVRDGVLAVHEFENNLDDELATYPLTNEGTVNDAVNFKLGANSRNWDGDNDGTYNTNAGLRTPEKSIAFWMKRGDVNRLQFITQHRLNETASQGILLFFQANNTLRLLTSTTGSSWTTSIISPTTITSTSAFYHIAMRQKSGQQELFINGVSKGTATAVGTLNYSTANFWLGKSTTENRKFEGNIDGIWQWDRWITDTDLVDHYNDGVGITYFEGGAVSSRRKKIIQGA